LLLAMIVNEVCLNELYNNFFSSNFCISVDVSMQITQSE
jgi:hypothetical protein